jgi:hypothetical protein
MSIVFKNMFTMPAADENPNTCEGTCDAKPIHLTAPFTVKKIDHLLRWFYRYEIVFLSLLGCGLITSRFGPEFPPLEALTSILELGTFLDMDMARGFAIQALAAPSMGLSAPIRLSLALSFRITEWTEPAFRELITTPANRVTAEDFTLLGSPVAHLIFATQAEIRGLRLAIAFNPLIPASHDPTCKKPVVGCQCSWEAAWWDGLARHYLHPDFPSTPREAISKLENTPIVGVTTACRLQAVRLIKDQRVFEMEDDIVENALKMLKSYEGTVFNI